METKKGGFNIGKVEAFAALEPRKSKLKTCNNQKTASKSRINNLFFFAVFFLQRQVFFVPLEKKSQMHKKILL
jgi:hypothetical protein